MRIFASLRKGEPNHHRVVRSFVDAATAVASLAKLHRNKETTQSLEIPPLLENSPLLETPLSRHSQPAGLAQELVETIISFLVYDIIALLACSTTCYSWYIAAVPHLHYSLTTDERRYWGYEKYNWPRPLREYHKHGLLSFVKRLSIRIPCGYPPAEFEFTPKWLGGRSLSHFSALTNLQELGIDHLKLSSFVPSMNHYFGHLAPTLRFLALAWPNGTSRQIIYFIGLFPQLQDLKLSYPFCRTVQDWMGGTSLVPLSIPPLRGCLTLTSSFAADKFVTDMIALFGGLRFRRMELFAVMDTRLLLHTCAETLDTLRLYPTDPFGMFFPFLFVGKSTSGLMLVHSIVDGRGPGWHFDLSRNKSLRTLETTAASITAKHAAQNFLTTVLSTISSPLPLDVIIDYDDVDVDRVRYLTSPGTFTCPLTLEDEITKNVLRHEQRFKLFREMYRVRGFRLVLCADVFNHSVGPAVQTLERLVRAEKEKGGLDYLRCEPLIISEKRTLQTHGINGKKIGWNQLWYTFSSAL